jgi:hypothetical protein
MNLQPIVRAEIQVTDLEVALAGIVLRDVNGSGLATFQGECPDSLITNVIKYFKLVGG